MSIQAAEGLPFAYYNAPGHNYRDPQASLPVEQSHFKQAWAAYLSYGDNQPNFYHLWALAAEMGDTSYNKYRDQLVVSGGAFLDMATHPQTSASDRTIYRDMAKTKFKIASENVAEARLKDQPYAVLAMLYQAYLPLYRTALKGNEVSEASEKTSLGSVYRSLVEAGQLGAITLEIAEAIGVNGDPEAREAVSTLRGALFEIGVHTLIYRYNLKNHPSRPVLWARPSLPRENQPFGKTDVSSGWDLGLSTKSFLDPEAKKIQLKTVVREDQIAYDSSVLVISGKDDLAVKVPAEISTFAYYEHYHPNPQTRALASQRLDEIEAKLLAKIEIGTT